MALAARMAGTVRCVEFLQWSSDIEDLGLFDAVPMNLPFAQGADIEHITHALTMSKPGGRLVALCANGPRQNASLRPMVEAPGGEWEDLPADTFKEEGTGVRVPLIRCRSEGGPSAPADVRQGAWRSALFGRCPEGACHSPGR